MIRMRIRHRVLLFVIDTVQAICGAWCLFCFIGAAVAWFTPWLAGDGRRWTGVDAVATAVVFVGAMVPAVLVAGVAARESRNIRRWYEQRPHGFEVVSRP